MKAISLLQPWATLIMLGYKQYETRSWATNHRGNLAIHASLGKPLAAREVAEHDPEISRILKRHGLSFDTLPRGVILGEVEVLAMRRIVSVEHPNSAGELAPSQLSSVELHAGDYSPGRWAWMLNNPMDLTELLPCKGARSIWEVPSKVYNQFNYMPF